ncbi:hypothetical protein PUN28_019690 [Cardiocondyla obscurior]|uniref:Uncharacterized protein n=1 Tax=Cardiocondyla obscurior TaxID=286306 RepID=A0AAW2EC05_9HYME
MAYGKPFVVTHIAVACAQAAILTSFTAYRRSDHTQRNARLLRQRYEDLSRASSQNSTRTDSPRQADHSKENVSTLDHGDEHNHHYEASFLSNIHTPVYKELPTTSLPPRSHCRSTPSVR